MSKEGDERVETSAPAVALIATGVMARTREQARQEMGRREASPRTALPRRIGSGTGSTSRIPESDLSNHAKMGERVEEEVAFLVSPRYADEETIQRLQRRPAIDLVVQNAPHSTAKQDEVLSARHAPRYHYSAAKAAPPSLGKRQSWFSPVHVPLSHRKLVESPRIFHGINPSKPLAARALSDSKNQTSASSTSRSLVPRVAMLQSALGTTKDGAASQKRRRTLDTQFIEMLKSRNQQLYEKLVARFKEARRIEALVTADRNADSQPSRPEVGDDEDALSGITSVEDAVLFFLHEKHSHDILYFKRRSDAHGSDQPLATGGLSLSVSFSANAKLDAASRFMPYDLERVTSPATGAGDFYIMSSTALVHHATGDENEIVGEAIPIAQWIMESKMFSLLLAGIPLFQKFLLRKVFMWWAMETRRLIFVDMKKRVGCSLPIGRRSFAGPMLGSFQALRRLQHIHALTLPAKHLTAINLGALYEHHRERLSDAETKLIDAKEELLQLMDAMVHEVRLNSDPSTQLDDLYSMEASDFHTVNPKWKSAPIKALRRRRESLTVQVETAKMDLKLLDKYVRLMEYMFTESVYLMLLGCVRHLTVELRSDENHGTISAAVAIIGDELVLSPSALETKNVLLEGIAKLIRLTGNFHFTKNAIAWSTNRGTGSLALVSSAFACEALASQFDLQEVLRNDREFAHVTSKLIKEVSNCFDEAAHQMKAFESLKPIYAAVQSVSRAETLRNLQQSGRNVNGDLVAELPSVVGISGGELARYLRTLSHRLAVLDRSQHACQKIQSSWKVGFLEIQCRRSVTEILELISDERETLHQHVFQLAAQGTSDCINVIQKASLIFEDRPQLIEYFCEQLKQVRVLKERERQLHQDIRNVDEVVRALKRYAPELLNESSVPYNLLHTMYSKYGMLTQSHDKFANKMLPSITQQVSSALQRYTVRCQRLLRLYEENAGLATEEELERNVGMFQDIAREIRSIGDATRLYQEYQKMVGMKVMEITILGEARERWDEVQEIVNFTLQWKTATKLMESGIFSDQPWKIHQDKVASFVGRIHALQQDRSRIFAAKLLDKLKGQICDYQRRLELVIEMAQPYVKAHHWQQVLAMLDIVNFVSASGVVLSDGSTLTLGFLQSRNLWKFEGHIREITLKARHDAVTESKIEDMKRRLYAAILPIVKIDELYELEVAGTLRLLGQFESDLVTVQALAQLTSSAQLAANLAQWAEEISNYQDILDVWLSVQTDWKRLALIFNHHDVQQILVDATYEFQAFDRKWRAMMAAAKGASSLDICLREVMSRVFLNTCAVTSEKLWKELGNYLAEKRHFFPRLYFVSDRDLLHIIASSRHPARLCRLISKCFREVHSLRITRVDTASRQRHGSATATTVELVPNLAELRAERPVDEDKVVHLFDIQGVVGQSQNEELSIKPLRVSSSPEIWLKDLYNRIHEAVKEAICLEMDGLLAGLYESNFAELKKAQPRHDSADQNALASLSGVRLSSVLSWLTLPLNLIVLCVNVMLTNELTPLVFADRNGSDWSSFWDGYAAKKQNLSAFIRRRDISARERLVMSNLLVVLLNKCDGIEDLQREELAGPASTAFSAQHHHQDTTTILYNYANGASFNWTKMMRFYYEPFDKKCVIHHSVKTHEYGNSFLGGYTCPVLTPLTDRVILALNLAVSLEVGAIMYSPHSYCAGKRRLLAELATSVGNELIPFGCATAVGYTQFYRFLFGALQSEACWVVLSGLESRTDFTPVQLLAREIGRLRDAVHGGLDSLSLDGVSINISNSRIGMFVCASLDLRSNTDHQELVLRLSHGFMPVACHPPDSARLIEVIFLSRGIKDAASLSRKLATLIQFFQLHPIRLLCVPIDIRHMVSIATGTATKHLSNPWKSEEKCLVASLWEEVSACMLPERRLAVVKTVRSIFPVAEELQLSPFGMLATRTQSERNDTSQASASNPSSSVPDEELAYDSDEDEQRQDLVRFREEVCKVMEDTKHLVATDQYVRKLIDLYHVVARNVMVVLVGQSGCGKTTALDILSHVLMERRCRDESNGAANDGSDSQQTLFTTSLDSTPKHLRLFPSAFHFQDIHGFFRDNKLWCDGFISKLFKTQCAGENMSRGSLPLATTTSYARPTTDADAVGTKGTRKVPSPSPWLVLDGVNDPSVLEPLKEVVNRSPETMATVQLPNGDQLTFENSMLRVFCEVAELDEWCPGTISRCAMIYFQADTVPYTVLIKSWANRLVQTKPKYSALATFMAKTARSMLPILLDVCKRHIKPFAEILVPHLVSNFLLLASAFVDRMVPDVSTGTLGNDVAQVKIVVVYAAMLSLGLCIQGKGQVEFHNAVVAAVPELVACIDLTSRTIFDINLSFENEQIVLSVFEAPLPSLMEGYASWNHHGLRRRSAFHRLSDGVLTRGGLIGLGTSSTLFVPTPRLLAYRAWMTTMLTAKMNVLAVGDCGIGKTRLLEDVLTDLIRTNQVDFKCLQINRSVSGEDVLNTVVSGLPRKMRGVYCPGPGKRSLVVAIENLNLESETCLQSGGKIRACSEMIRQVCDAKGSFVRATKEFVEFQDVVVACSFSLSPYGYPRLPARLLRHFHVIWMSDPTRDVFRTVLATFPEQLMARLPATVPFQPSDVARLCRFPIETFHAIRKHMKPTPQSPHLLLSLNEVLRCLSRLMNVSAKSTESFTDLENFSLFSSYQLFRSRMMDSLELSKLQSISVAVAKQLGYSVASIDVIANSAEYIYADYGDNEGCVRITSRAAMALFVAADERFQWYNRAAAKDPSQLDEQDAHGTAASSGTSMGISPLPLIRKVSTIAISSTAATGPSNMESGPGGVGNLEPHSVDTASDGTTPPLIRRTSALSSPTPRPHHVVRSTATSPATIQNMLDVLSFLQSGVRHLLFCGAEPSKRRCATMIACGAQAFHFREVTSQLRVSEYTEQLKVPIMEAGLKASYTLLYADCDSISPEEFRILIHVMLQSDLPHHMYSSSDKAKILAQEHQLRTFQQSHLRRPSVSSFFDDLTAVTSTRDGMIALQDPHKGGGTVEMSESPLSPQKRSVYRENLRRCLYVVLSFGTSMKMYDLVSSHPTLYYQASVKTFRWFDRDSLEAVYTDSLGGIGQLNDVLARASVSADTLHDLQSLAIAIHEDAMRLLQCYDGLPTPDELGRRFGASRSRLEDFLNSFKALFLNQKAQMTELQDSIFTGLALMERDVREANDQLSKSADGKLHLLEAAETVAESSQRLQEYESMDRDARRAFLLDEQRCSSLHSEVEQEREMIQNELNKTLPDVSKATDALSQINKYHITEMKSFVNPPQLVRLAMQAVCVLLGAPPTWTEALRILADIHFLDRLRNFDKDHVDASLIDRVKLYVNHPDFSMENMKRASIASTTLCKWVLALVRYFEVMKRVAPTQRKLNHTEEQFSQIDRMVQAERQKLVDLEMRLNDLRAEHAKNVQHEQELQRVYESKTRWKAEVIHFEAVATQWLKVLKTRAARIKDQQFKLVGDCAIMAAASTYASAIPYEDRYVAVCRWRELALRYLNGRPSRTSPRTSSVSMPHVHSFLRGWTISGEMLNDEFKRAILAMDVRDDVPLMINMLLMNQIQKLHGKYPVLIDPLGRATVWLKRRCRAMPVQDVDADEHSERDGSSDVSDESPTNKRMRHAAAVNLLHRFNVLVVVDACDPNAVALVEKRITHKTPLLILIDHVSECEEASFHALLDVVVIAKKKGGHTVIFSACGLDNMLSWKPKIWSQLGVIECSPTSTELEEHVLSCFLTHYWPTLEADFEAACDDYVAEKSKEDQVIGGFLEFLQKLSDEREAAHQAYGSASTRVDHDGAAVVEESAGLHEHDMSRITRCLDEYVVVKKKRNAAKQCVLVLRDQRKLFEGFAKHTRAFFFAEKHLFRGSVGWHPSLTWHSNAIVQHVEDCVREHIPSAARVHGSLAGINDHVTHVFMRRRLMGLPAELHRPYRFLLAVGVGMTRDSVDTAFVQRLTSSQCLERVFGSATSSERSAKQTSDRDEGDTDAETDPLIATARNVAGAIVASAIQRVVSTAIGYDQVAPSVPKECRAIFKRIKRRFLDAVQIHDTKRALELSLAQDMRSNPDTWQTFALSPTIGILLDGNEEDEDGDDSAPLMPQWVKQLSVLPRFLLCVSAFDVLSVEMVDTVVAFYLGDESELDVTKSVSDAERSLSGTSARPLVVHYLPQRQVSAPFSSIVQCARIAGVREESISYVSMRNEIEVQKLRLLREFHASGAWLVVQEAALARQSALNSLRMELERLHELLATSSNKTGGSHEFRLWILNALGATNGPAASREKSVRFDVITAPFFLEYPTGIRGCYRAFALDEQVRKRQLEKQQQAQLLMAVEGSAHVSKAASQRLIAPAPAKRSSLVTLFGTSSSISPVVVPPDQMWIQGALWIFHSLLRNHASCGGDVANAPRAFSASGTTTGSSRESIPLDIVASQHELERAMRLIQLHQRQRTLAATMAAVSGLGTASLSTASPVSEWTTMYELASEVYSAKTTNASLSQLHRDLLAASLMSGTSGAVSGWSRACEWQQRLLTTRDMIAQRDTAALSIDEAHLMPHSLRWQHQVASCRATMAPLDPRRKDGAANSFSRLVAESQRHVGHLKTVLPSKDCLSLGVQRQEHQRRTVVMTAWRKNRPADPQPPPPDANASKPPAEVKHPARSPKWERAVLNHLLQSELPAMEMYVRHIWGLLEYLASLNVEKLSPRADALYEELGETLNALCKGMVPPSWTFVKPAIQTRCNLSMQSGRNGATYPAPKEIERWAQWVKKTVSFYQSVTNETRVPETLWLPALGYPHACLFAIRHSLAMERGILPDSLSFVVFNPTNALSSEAESSAATALSGDQDVLASFQVSGLVLWNARWSAELYALRESVTTQAEPHHTPPSQSHGTLDELPTLTVHVTARFAATACDPRTLADAQAHPFLYRCPVFQRQSSLVRLEDPIAHLFVPTVDRASVHAACGVALLLERDLPTESM